MKSESGGKAGMVKVKTVQYDISNALQQQAHREKPAKEKVEHCKVRQVFTLVSKCKRKYASVSKCKWYIHRAALMTTTKVQPVRKRLKTSSGKSIQYNMIYDICIVRYM